MKQHEQFMQRALDLAKKAWPNVAPNPMVGCVIVCNNNVVAEAYHLKFGDNHAEVNAIKKLPSNINPLNCTLYVTLEPCSHFGKTPPCADLIINTGFKNVVIACADPNFLVKGKGIEKLQGAGINVIIGVLEDEAKKLNKRFFTFHSLKRPYYILKWAQTFDGFISRQPPILNKFDNIIGDESQQLFSHELRASEMAIMVGKNTVLNDNPSLTTRLVKGKNPVRIVIDKNLEIPKSFNIYNAEANTIVFNAIEEGQKENILFIKLNFNSTIITQISEQLFLLNIQSVIVEGGTFLLNEFIKMKCYDEVYQFINPKLKFNKGIKAPDYKI
ncbi:MAG: bifunctional diaminohydroxyphosphoribosylaminopyrimidine deaminase/5-amino-6-(5-phosphoribosylamino)uracil reductase RibD [Bacteroidetes bacterium]|nr:bifunctional diaminohydroxyphosphoribosylaminopyrimidine deaminase/5-amino-6-(5-phosphoribosylamino)uracil reductase RibD [Bacteroidota bacterium]